MNFQDDRVVISVESAAWHIPPTEHLRPKHRRTQERAPRGSLEATQEYREMMVVDVSSSETGLGVQCTRARGDVEGQGKIPPAICHDLLSRGPLVRNCWSRGNCCCPSHRGVLAAKDSATGWSGFGSTTYLEEAVEVCWSWLVHFSFILSRDFSLVPERRDSMDRFKRGSQGV